MALYVFAWIFWFFLVIFNLIVFFNFLIALVTDVYESVMKTKDEETYRKKALLISEHIQLYIENYNTIYRAKFWPSVLLHRTKRENEILNQDTTNLAEIKTLKRETQEKVTQET